MEHIETVPDRHLFGITCRPADQQEPGWNYHVIANDMPTALRMATAAFPYKMGDAIVVMELPFSEE